MACNSRRKGKEGELEAAKKLREYGYDVHRSQQFCGKNGDADLYGLPNVHLEIKRVQHLNLYDAIEQSVRDARQNEMPVVMHRKDRKGWLVTMELDDFMQLYKWSEWEDARFCQRCGTRLSESEVDYCDACEGDLFG